ncbi:hypothetical protein EB796_005198 [Bugula neritina]|uniref:Uncharacterized protein n=1 Tax=Bugula neritina TaxID=10212 RepID=A0A7J7KDY4_BUGNE|nr:hypothetical protein EB796_005198 [Bugula neritina]
MCLHIKESLHKLKYAVDLASMSDRIINFMLHAAIYFVGIVKFRCICLSSLRWNCWTTLRYYVFSFKD